MYHFLMRINNNRLQSLLDGSFDR